ncbi:aPHC-domain-containing protein [Neocallimastix lanati (nom. inval.)]|uniref:APHC-domain-containing protein n=1 Tax=Neocallimastix californiae TaxID=1754190 RepID=A0A1Y2ATM2_9FUNG|nr:aPHC-domain-containing protein [Neocallimastix sp. JGI-2020a]ORY25285.1 aPHC-domain-containing protein [Neocallimastix californiae]|eukprot:ORY25285.1 aPHC-domain-containing protein [Neocallimastix californiae]
MWSIRKYHYEQRYFWANFGLLCIGIGSWLFHMTLKYQMELADELPMIYTCYIAIFCIFEISNDCTYRPRITLILWLAAILFTLTYTEIISWPWFQHGATIFLIGIIVFRSLYTINILLNEEKLLCYKSNKNSIASPILINNSKDSKSWISNKKHIKKLICLLIICAFTYIFAFLLWNIDNLYCNHLIRLRHQFKFLSFLFQFHAWWHFFTGIGTYGYFIFNLYLRRLLLGYESTKIKWLFHLIPYVAHDHHYNDHIHY